MIERNFLTAAGALAMLGILGLGLLSVPLQNGRHPDPRDDTSGAAEHSVQPGKVDLRDVRGCPIILGLDGDPGICAYNPDGTINAYREEGWTGWILVE